MQQNPNSCRYITIAKNVDLPNLKSEVDELDIDI